MAAAAASGGEPLPAFVAPMLATLGPAPPPGHDPDWAYETKWDGVRACVRWDGRRLTLTSRNELEMTVAYPELAALGEQLGDTQAVLDGEIVALDPDGRSSFARLQRRMHVGDAEAARVLARVEPAVLMLFDVLHLDGRSALDLRYTDRRSVLEGLDLDGEAWRTPAVMEGTAEQVIRRSRADGLEGVIAKRRASGYRPGRRSPDWIKLKNLRTQDVVVGGWRAGLGARAGTIGSLLLGLPAPGGLRYAGRVGTGFTAATLADLSRRLRASAGASNPFLDVPRADTLDATWVTPTLVGEVAFAEWTPDGRLRHPVWRGLRPDRSPHDVTRSTG